MPKVIPIPVYPVTVTLGFYPYLSYTLIIIKNNYNHNLFWQVSSFHQHILRMVGYSQLLKVMKKNTHHLMHHIVAITRIMAVPSTVPSQLCIIYGCHHIMDSAQPY